MEMPRAFDIVASESLCKRKVSVGENTANLFEYERSPFVKPLFLAYILLFTWAQPDTPKRVGARWNGGPLPPTPFQTT